MLETGISFNSVNTAIEQAQEIAKRNHSSSLRIVDQNGTTVFRARSAAILGNTFIAFNGQKGNFFPYQNTPNSGR